MPPSILYNKSNYTTENSIRDLPIFRGNGETEIRYLDRVARTTIINLIDSERIM